MPNKLFNSLALALCFVMAASAQVSVSDRFAKNNFAFKMFMPTAADTVLASKTAYIGAIVLVNNSGAAVTLRIRDRSTDCNGAACPIYPDDISIPAGTTWTSTYPFLEATGGITWSASSANAVVGRITGTY